MSGTETNYPNMSGGSAKIRFGSDYGRRKHRSRENLDTGVNEMNRALGYLCAHIG